MIIETPKKKISDFATLLTVAGVLLYSLGWLYWSNYYTVFNINSSFTNISFDKIISTTWPFLLAVSSGFVLSIQHFFDTIEEEFDIINSIYVVVNSIIILAILTIQNISLMVAIYLIFIILYKIIVAIIKKKKIPIPIISRMSFLYSLLLVFYITCAVYYIYTGQKEAKKLFSNYEEDIQISLNHKNEIMIGKLISHMDNKYF